MKACGVKVTQACLMCFRFNVVVMPENHRQVFNIIYLIETCIWKRMQQVFGREDVSKTRKNKFCV